MPKSQTKDELDTLPPIQDKICEICNSPVHNHQGNDAAYLGFKCLCDNCRVEVEEGIDDLGNIKIC